METKNKLTDEQIKKAVEVYPSKVTGAMAGCKHPEAVLRYALAQDGPCANLARNYVLTLHGACWNAMAAVLPAEGWIIWHTAAARGHFDQVQP